MLVEALIETAGSRSTSTLSPLVSYYVSEEEDVQDCYDSAFKQAYLAAWIMSLMFLWDYAAYATQERNVNIFNTSYEYLPEIGPASCLYDCHLGVYLIFGK